MYKSIRNYENINKAVYGGAGPYGIPQLKLTHCDIAEWIDLTMPRVAKIPAERGSISSWTIINSSGYGIELMIIYLYLRGSGA